ncbi:MAG: hypothetical protein ABIO62_15475 [Paracoccaceae bacterium]
MLALFAKGRILRLCRSGEARVSRRLPIDQFMQILAIGEVVRRPKTGCGGMAVQHMQFRGIKPFGKSIDLGYESGDGFLLSPFAEHNELLRIVGNRSQTATAWNYPPGYQATIIGCAIGIICRFDCSGLASAQASFNI